MDAIDLNIYDLNYNPPKQDLWNGRASDLELKFQYWYQQIECHNLQNDLTAVEKPNFAIIGYACDEGVRRNLGRIGAKNGPDAIRKQLSRFAFNHPPKRIIDFGNIIPVDEDMENCQAALAWVTEQLLLQDIFPIVLGGGHDVAFGHFMGIERAVQKRGIHSIGIINFDAHFDLRPSKEQSNSGTPFYQILNKYENSVAYFVLGIQSAANSPELFSIAKQKGVNYLLNDYCELTSVMEVKNQLNTFIQQHDYLYITIDLDGFSSAYAPGVSAPSPLGFSPSFIFKILKHLFQTQKIVALDLAELNPKYDQDGVTARLAAHLLDTVVRMKNF
ncbi:MAG: formimidoylglutamase [Flavobacteriaceae bacterium]